MTHPPGMQPARRCVEGLMSAQFWRQAAQHDKIENHSHAAAVWRAVELSKTSPAGMMSEGDWRHQSWRRPVGKHRLDPGRKRVRRVPAEGKGEGEGEGKVLALGAEDYRNVMCSGLVAPNDQSDSA